MFLLFRNNRAINAKNAEKAKSHYGAYPATFTIYRNSIVTENWNIPYVYGQIDLNTMKPHRKNPTIAKVFSQIGIVGDSVSSHFTGHR